VLLVLAAVPLLLLVALPASALSPRLLSGRTTRRATLAITAIALLAVATVFRLLV
jgi:hypothetical protein